MKHKTEKLPVTCFLSEKKKKTGVFIEPTAPFKMYKVGFRALRSSLRT